MQRMRGWVCKLAVGVTLMVSAAQADDITVFAASSLREAVSDIAVGYETDTGDAVTLVFAASSSLARQVAQGAPADVVLLADQDWADWLVDQGAGVDMAPFASNRLVLVGLAGDTWLDLDGLTDALSGANLAMAQVDAVPAGRYGKAALEELGLWDSVSPHVVQAANVRAALRFVERGEAAFGIGYASDLVALPDLRELFRFGADTHPPIAYLGGNNTPAGSQFMTYLYSDAGQNVLDQWGFMPVEEAQ